MNPYESELFEIINEALMRRYGGAPESDLYPILIIRHQLLHSPKDYNSLLSFLLSELNLSENCRYKEMKINEGFAIQHFLDNLAFRASYNYEEKDMKYIKEEIEKIAKIKTKKFRTLPEYEYFFKAYVIEEIKRHFMCEFMPPKFVDSIVYESDELIFERTPEERLDAYIHAVKLHSDHVAFVSEQKVEDYLVKHLDLIEDGMSFVERQVIVPDGRVDILAKDKNGNHVIIEVKVEEDKDILWQCMYYPDALNQVKKTGKVRVITMCPDYTKHILEPLSKLDYVEAFKYTLFSESGEIREMKARRIRNLPGEKTGKRVGKTNN